MAYKPLNLMILKKAQTNSSPEKNLFNRLTKQLSELKKQYENLLKDLKSLRETYYATIQPLEIKIDKLQGKRIQIAYEWLQKKSLFTKQERGVLGEWILEEIHHTQKAHLTAVSRRSLHDIFHTIAGVSYEQTISEKNRYIKEHLHTLAQQMNVEVELDDIDFNHSFYLIMQVFNKKLSDAQQATKDFSKDRKKKAKRQLKKEATKNAQHMIQLQSLNGVYKSLVKVIHPDLETDPDEKYKKECFMKRLTVAYHTKDIASLWALQLEVVPLHDNTYRMYQCADLTWNEYNKMLKKQIQDYKNLIQVTPQDTFYTPLRPYCPPEFNTHEVANRLNKKHEEFHTMHQQLEMLATDKAYDFFKELLGNSIERKEKNKDATNWLKKMLNFTK